MTDTNDTAPESAVKPSQAPAGADSGQVGDATPDGAQEAPSAAREAAKYRRRLREVEQERDGLLEQVAGHHRAAVERIAADQMSTPGDLWLAGVELADVLGDTGDPDDEMIGAAVEQVLVDRPHWRKSSAPSFDGGVRATVADGDSWAKVLRRR